MSCDTVKANGVILWMQTLEWLWLAQSAIMVCILHNNTLSEMLHTSNDSRAVQTDVTMASPLEVMRKQPPRHSSFSESSPAGTSVDLGRDEMAALEESWAAK